MPIYAYIGNTAAHHYPHFTEMSITFATRLLFQSATSQIDVRMEEDNVLRPVRPLPDFDAQKFVLDGVSDIITS